MRTLLYVPVIHTSADLGSLAKEVAKRGKADLGEDLWEEHRKTVNGFWNAILDYFDSVDVSGMKIYQDGMVADGEVGNRIVEEGVRSGSKNYELVWKLLKRGAILMKTEDFKLVKEERDRLLAITQPGSTVQKIVAFIRYKFAKSRLLDKRDKFIAKRIDESLSQDEIGIVFLGAYHNINKGLSRDIKIIEIKNAQKVKRYHMLLPFYHKQKSRLEELANYLISGIGQPFYKIK